MFEAAKCVAVSAVLAVAGAAHAHEGHDHAETKDQHVKGTLKSVEASKLVVKATDGKTVNVHVDDGTKYENGAAAGAVTDLQPGLKVVVYGELMKDGVLHATKVRFAKPAPKTPSGPAKTPAKAERGNHAH